MLIHRQPRYPQDGNGIGWEFLLKGRGYRVRRHIAWRDGHETGDPVSKLGHVCRADMMAELILSGVALEEAIQLDIAASKLRAAIVRLEQADAHLMFRGIVLLRHG